MKERHAWNSHADKINGKTTKVEFILNGSKLEQRVTVEGKDQFSLRLLPTKILRIIDILNRKEVRHMQKQCKVLEHQNLVGKFLNS